MMSLRLLLKAVLSLAALAVPALAELGGGYRGIDAAEGMRLEFSVDGDRYQGVFTDRNGVASPFDADLLESGAETIIERDGQRIYMLFNEEPLGVTTIVIPMTEADELITNRSEALVFLKDGVVMPPRPARYVPPPAGPGGTIDPQAFVESYAFWPSVNVGYGYQMVRGRYRTLIRLHPVVQTDILWKLCRAQTAPAALAEALRGQGVVCSDVLSAFGRMMRDGGSIEPFNRFRRDVEAEKAALVEAIRCSIDYKRNDPECKRSGARLAKAAVSLVTVKSVLARY